MWWKIHGQESNKLSTILWFECFFLYLTVFPQHGYHLVIHVREHIFLLYSSRYRGYINLLILQLLTRDTIKYWIVYGFVIYYLLLILIFFSKRMLNYLRRQSLTVSLYENVWEKYIKKHQIEAKDRSWLVSEANKLHTHVAWARPQAEAQLLCKTCRGAPSIK